METNYHGIKLLGSLDYKKDCSDIWGYKSDDGTEYALMGVYDGTAIIDTSTNPLNPKEVAFIRGPKSIWRDIKTYSNYAYIVHDGTDGDTPIGMQIVNMKNPESPIVETYKKGFNRAHNLWITDNYLYICGAFEVSPNRSYAEKNRLMYLHPEPQPGDQDVGTIILDLQSNPMNPKEVGRFTKYYVHDIYVRNNIGYAGCIEGGGLPSREPLPGFMILDLTDKAHPSELIYHSYPKSMTHNTWLTEDGKYLLTTDERDPGGHLKIWNISKLDNIFLASEYEAKPNIVIHNVLVKSQFAYISYYVEGLVILDISNPAKPLEVGRYDTYNDTGSGDNFHGAWGVYPFNSSGRIFVSDIESGFLLFERT
jgi:choice-of-anchor B domain-containing protein